MYKRGHTRVPTEDAEKTIAINQWDDEKGRYKRALSCLDEQLSRYDTLFNDEDVPISKASKMAKPILGSLFSNQAINHKERYFDLELITLKQAYDALKLKRQQLSNKAQKQISGFKIVSHASSDIAAYAHSLAEKTSKLNQLNTALTEKFEQLSERLLTIELYINQLSIERDKFIQKADLLESLLISCDFDPGFAFDINTKTGIRRLREYDAERLAFEKELQIKLQEQVSAKGRKIYQDAAHRYETAKQYYVYFNQKLDNLCIKIEKTIKALNDTQHTLRSKASHFLEHLSSLKDRTRLLPLKLDKDTLSTPPYNEFDIIKKNALELNLYLSELDTIAQQRLTDLSNIDKSKDWIESHLNQEEHFYQQLKEAEEKVQSLFNPIEEKVFLIQQYAEETKLKLSEKFETGFVALSSLFTTLVALNQTIKGVGLNPTALKSAQRAVDDCDLTIKAFKEYAQSLKTFSSTHILYSERITLIKQLNSRIDIIANEIELSKKRILDSIISEKKFYNQEVYKILENLNQLKKSRTGPFFNYPTYYLDAGTHRITLHNQTHQIRIPRTLPPMALTINDSLSESLLTLCFPSSPYDSKLEKGLFFKKREELAKLNQHIQSIETDTALALHCHHQRSQSEEIKVIQSIRAVITTQLTQHFITEIDQCHKLLQEIEEQIDLLEQKYCHLQIRNRDDFIKQAIQTVEKAIIHNNLDHLSDQENKPMIQFVRRYILSPLKHLLEKTAVINKGHLTFFASQSEIEMHTIGMTAKHKLEAMTHPAQIH